jgi:hypothetical protein
MRFSWLPLCALLIQLQTGCGGRATESLTVSRQEQSQIIRRLRRLSNREYNNVVRDLLWDDSRPANAFLDDSYANGYDNGSALLTVQTDQALRYQTAAEQLAERAMARHLVDLLGGCNPDLSGADACADRFFETFPQRAFRRPAKAGEIERLRSVYAYASAAGGFRLGIQTALEAVLQSPAFLYREELGSAPVNGRTQLNDYELASQLSFFLTGTMPDDELLEAASQGRVHARDDLRRQGARLLQTANARANLREFFHQWLATNRLAGLTKDRAVYPRFSPALAASMGTELNLFLDHVLWEGSGSLRELFTSSDSFADQALGSLYGLSEAAAFQLVQLDPSLRKGILTRAGYLAVHSATSHSSPVERGVFVRQALLCTQLPPPPPDVLQMSMMQPANPNQTTRERFAEHSTNPFCQGCHRLIDPVGFGFEQFDGLGVFRTTENGRPVDSSGNLIGTRDIDGEFNGASQLAERLVSSNQFRDCVVTQMFRFATGRAETSYDSDSLLRLSRRFSADRQLAEQFLSFIEGPLFSERIAEEP